MSKATPCTLRDLLAGYESCVSAHEDPRVQCLMRMSFISGVVAGVTEHPAVEKFTLDIMRDSVAVLHELATQYYALKAESESVSAKAGRSPASAASCLKSEPEPHQP